MWTRTINFPPIPPRATLCHTSCFLCHHNHHHDTYKIRTPAFFTSSHTSFNPIRSHTKEQYHSTDDPIPTFGYASGFSEKYELGKRIGAGTFGTVHICTDQSSGAQFAVKRMPKRFAANGMLDIAYSRRIRNEVDIGNHLGRSLNVASVVEVFETDTEVDLVVELCTGGELWDRIKQYGGQYSERDAAKIIAEMLRTVAQCHAQGVMMRDIKPENFLFANPSPDAPLKAIDFGISIFCEPNQTIEAKAGTPIYLAPEILRGKYTMIADVWSVGIVAYQLLTGRLPFTGDDGDEVAELYMEKQQCNNKDVFRAVLYSELDFERSPWDVLSPGAKDLVSSLLTRNCDNRPTAQQALSHPWLQQEGGVGSASVVPLGEDIVQRLQRYGVYGRLKQAALRKIAHAAIAANAGDSGVPAALREMFSRLDPGNTGRVELDVLRQELVGGHFELLPEEAEQLLTQIDINEDRYIDWEEWVAAMADWKSIRDSAGWEKLVTDAFRTMDKDLDAGLGAEDLEALLCGEEGCATPDWVDAALREADADGDGMVGLDDLKGLLMGHESDLALFDSRVAEEENNAATKG